MDDFRLYGLYELLIFFYMSRIGKKPVLLPAGVDVTIGQGKVDVKGPKGILHVYIPSPATVSSQDDPRTLLVSVPDESNLSNKAIWGLTRQLIANAVEGVQTPFKKSLELVGVGFKVAQAGSTLTLEVGFSHPVVFKLPEGVEATVDKQVVTFTGSDKQLIGETAAQFRRIRPPEPYKGKGIKFTTEVVRRKAGKTATKSA